MRSSTRLTVAAPLALAAVLAVPGIAQEALPKSEEILEKYIEVTGGRAAHEKLRTMISTGSIEFVGKGIRGSVAIYRAAPNRSYSIVELPGIGRIEEGVDGEVAWTNSAMQGPRIKEGDERALSLRAAMINGELRWRELYKSTEVTGVEDVGGQPCYKVVMTPPEGGPQTRHYEKESGLLVKLAMVLKSPMGEAPIESVLGDYRRERELLLPHRIAQKVLGQEFIIQIDTLQQNPDIPDSRFELPEEIRALQAKKAAAK